MSLFKFKAWLGLVFLVLVLASGLFIPAGTFDYWQAWVFLSVFTLATSAITLYLMCFDPALLQKRVKAGPVAEQQLVQKVIQSSASIAFIAIFVVSALDHRFAWSQVGAAGLLMGNLLVAGGLLLVFWVFRANAYTSALIEVMAEQRVISTGPYAWVRHPMYAGAFIMLVGIPLALGSWWGLLAVLPLMGVIVWRLKAEEAFLAQSLAGYSDYLAKVKHRLVPWVW
jgi:protein-S-isoprenylcysteine O-methyltransferase Ste14